MLVLIVVINVIILKVDKSLDNKVPKLQHWLHVFLQDNRHLERENTKYNKLVLEVRF